MRRAGTVGGALLVALAVAPDARATDAPPGFRPFAPDSIFNLPLRDDAPVDRASRASVAWLDATVRARGVGIVTAQCTQPLFWAAADAPRARVELVRRYRDPALRAAWASVPIPPDLAPADCGDANASIAQVQPGGAVTTWEFYRLRRQGTRWTAEGGGVIDDVRTDRGVASPFAWTNPRPVGFQDRRSTRFWNVTAASISMNAGVITRRDVLRRRIDHALGVALPSSAAGKWRWPAQRGDGFDPNPQAIAEGARLRLDPRVRVGRLPGPPLVRILARTAQRHGIVVRDQTAAQTIFYTEGRPGRAVPLGPILSGQPTYEALRRFPWRRLQLLEAPTCTSYATECRVTPAASVAVDRRRGTAVRLDTSNSRLNYPRVATTWRIAGGRRPLTRRCGTCVRLRLDVPRGARRVVRVTIRTAGGESVQAHAVVRGRRR